MSENNVMNYCMHCMAKMDVEETVCPKCGHESGNENTPSFALAPATILKGKYLVGMVMGQGGFGITYIGFDLLLQEKVAIKEYYPQNISTRSHDSRTITWFDHNDYKSGCENFLKEARNMATLAKLNSVVTVHDMFYENETAYIVMDFIEGETLKSKLKREGPMSFDTCIRLLEPIMEGLGQVHQSGIIHRDIKPDNIMIQPDGKAILLDLGAAKNLSAQGNVNLNSSLVITNGFSPLEQYMNEGKMGPWSDVYALTATIVYAVTGKVVKEALSRIKDKDLIIEDPKNNIPRDKLPVLIKGLALNQKDRYQNVDELRQALLHGQKFSVKKIIAAGICVAVLGAGAAAFLYTVNDDSIAHGECGEQIKWTLNEEGLLTIKGKGAIDNYEDNSVQSDDGKKSTSTTAPWYEYKDSITSLEIEDGIESIGQYDFTYLDHLSSVALPDSLLAIDQCAFGYTTLAEITLPASVETIGKDAFLDCEKLKLVEISAKVKELDNNPFEQCISLTSIKVSADNSYLNSVDGVLFSEDNSILLVYPEGKKETEYSLPDGVKEIGASAFSGNACLEKITLPEGLTKIDEYAFNNITTLKKINIPSSVTSIGDGAFMNCGSVKKLNLPDGLNTIGKSAFSGMTSLKKITIPAGVTKIEEQTFNACTSLSSLTIPASVESIGSEAFANEKEYLKVTFMGAPELDNTENAGAFQNTIAIMTIPHKDGDDLYASWDNGDKCLNYGGSLTWITSQPEPTEEDTDADNLFDNNTKTKWQVNFSEQKDKNWCLVLKFKLPEPVEAEMLYTTTGDDNSENHGRNPAGFKLYGYDDDIDDYVLITINDIGPESRDDNETTYEDVLAGGKYQYFKLLTCGTQGAGIMQLSEIKIKNTKKK